MKIDRQWVACGLWLGPVLTAVGYFGLGTIAQWPSSDLILWGLLVFPTVVLLLATAVAAVRRRDPTRWVSMAIGAAVGAVAVVVIAIAGMSLASRL
jgi:FtsH-binding integral membrane protein